MPSTFVALKMMSHFSSAARRAAAESVVKNGLPGAGRADDDAALLEMPDGAAADERLGDLGHRDRARHARGDAAALERILQGDGVDDRGQHPHVIAGHAVDPLGGRGHAAEDVSAADDDGDLDAHRCTSPISSAIVARTSASMPLRRPPMRASPESLRRMRLYLGAARQACEAVYTIGTSETQVDS